MRIFLFPFLLQGFFSVRDLYLFFLLHFTKKTTFTLLLDECHMTGLRDVFVCGRWALMVNRGNFGARRLSLIASVIFIMMRCFKVNFPVVAF